MKLCVYAVLLAALLAGVSGFGVYLHHKWYGAGEAHGLADCAHRVTQLDGKSRDACGTAIAALKGGYAQAYDDGMRREQAQRAAQAAQLAASEARHKQEMQDAKDAEIRTVADLRSGYLKLRKQWQCPATAAMPTSPAGKSVADAATDDRDQSAAAIVRAADEADAQIRALQAVVTADRAAQVDGIRALQK